MPAASFRTFLLLALTILSNFVLWLDSFDRYVNSRYHVSLAEVLPDALFVPSQTLATLLALPAENEHKAAAPVAIAEQEPRPSSGATAAIPSPTGDNKAAAAPIVADPDATPRILFAGDSMMQGLAPLAIPQIRKAFPNGFFSDQSKQSTGLTVRRYFDWPTKIKDEISDKRFDTLIIFLGPNDPWDIYESGKRFVFPSDDWIAKYRSRVVEVMEYCRDRRVKVIWIGLPNMRDERLQRGASVENRIFQEEAARFGFDYLSTEDILGPLDQPFRKYIEDPQKGRITVRADDGIHFTPSGLRLINTSLVELIRKRVTG